MLPLRLLVFHHFDFVNWFKIKKRNLIDLILVNVIFTDKNIEMTIENAIKLKQAYISLIGEEHRGAIIEHIIILPNNREQLNDAMRVFLDKLDSDIILTSSNGDYQVLALMDLKYHSKGILLQANLLQLILDKNLEIDLSEYGIEN